MTKLVFSPDGDLLASASDSTVQLWNVDTDEPIGAPLTGHIGEIFSMAFSPDGQRLATGGQDKTVWLSNAHTGQPVAPPLVVHTADVFGMAFTRDGQRLITASWDGVVRNWPTSATPETLCDKITTNVGSEQWRRVIGADVNFMTLCPQLPTPGE